MSFSGNVMSKKGASSELPFCLNPLLRTLQVSLEEFRRSTAMRDVEARVAQKFPAFNHTYHSPPQSPHVRTSTP
jgi:hypothetical protein